MKKYQVYYTDQAVKQLKKLNPYTTKLIYAWIDKNLQSCTDPRAYGKSLTANRSGTWRYRIGDYRLICMIDDDKLIVLALAVGHRRDIYDM